MGGIKLPQKQRESVVKWLHETVEPNIKYSEHDERLSPYYVSTTAQIAKWRGITDRWNVEQRGRWSYILVACDDDRVILEIALKFS